MSDRTPEMMGIDPEKYATVDIPFFMDQLDDFLPDTVCDFHLHVNLAEHTPEPDEEKKRTNWPSAVPRHFPAEHMLDVQHKLFPSRNISTLAFALPNPENNLQALNQYMSEKAHDLDEMNALYVARPYQSPGMLEKIIREGGFLGLKPYMGLASHISDVNAVKIDDYLPPAHQQLAHDMGLIVILHIPGLERLRDPQTVADIKRIRATYPNMKLVIAHIGRAYTMSFAEPGLEMLNDVDVYYDFSANMNEDVIALALQKVGPERLIYGSDFPILLMRGVREYAGDQYVNFTSEPYAWNTNRKSPEEEARYTYYIYEQLAAFKRAAEKVGLGPDDVAKVMYGNAHELINSVKI